MSDKTYNSYLNEAAGDSIIKFNGFMFDNPMNSESTVTALNKFIPKSIDMPGVPNVSYIGMFRELFSSFGVFTFIGLFLGILFMFATGSIMYYKQIIEAREEASRYDILRKTGIKKEEVKKSISKQLGIVFACPLLVGMLHTFPCLLVNNRMSGVLSKETPTLLNALAMMAIFVAAYGFFYVISVRKYLRIVWNK